MSWGQGELKFRLEWALEQITGYRVPVDEFPLNLDRRRELITGTDLAAVMGASEYRDLRAVIGQKLSGIQLEQTPQMELGSILEGHMAEWWVQENAEHIKSLGITRATIGEWRESDDKIGCTYDLLLYKGDLPVWAVDFKTTSKDNFWSEVPPDAFWQFQAQAILAGLPGVQAYVMNRSSGERRLWWVGQDPSLAAEMMEAVDLAMQYLNAGILPEANDVKPKTKKIRRPPTEEEMEIIQDIAVEKEYGEEAAAKIAELRQKLDALIEPGTTIEIPEDRGTITKAIKKTGGTVAWKELALAFKPSADQIAAATSPPGQTTVLTIKFKGQDDGNDEE